MLKTTPLNALHRAAGARMVDFGGWDMPVQYPAGTIAEHLRTRTHAGLFDVSHMGRLRIDGPGGAALLDRLLTRKVEGLGICLFDAVVSDDPTALVGLPLIATARLLREAGFRLP